MKKVILSALMFSAVMVSCSDNGNQTEAKDAVTVEVVKTETTVKYATISPESHIEWRASHLAGTQPRFGKAMISQGEVLVTDNVITNAKVVIDMNKFTVENFEDQESTDKLTGHLKSDDFFMIEKYPTSAFVLSGIKSQEGEYNSVVTGNLTILEVTKSITFNANVTVSDESVSVKSEDFVVNRTDWGLKYNTEGTVGVPTDYLISNDLGFTIDVTLSK